MVRRPYIARHSSAFTLVELLVSVLLLSLLPGLIPFNFILRRVNPSSKTVLSDLNNMLSVAKQEAILSGRGSRLFFKISNERRLSLIVEKKVFEDGSFVYKKIESYYFDAEYKFPDVVKVVSVYIDGNLVDNEVNEFSCYVSSSTLCQSLKIMLEFLIGENIEQVTFILEPFLGEFNLKKGFIISFPFLSFVFSCLFSTNSFSVSGSKIPHVI
jgi:hypothetical protein